MLALHLLFGVATSFAQQLSNFYKSFPCAIEICAQ